MAKLYLKFEDKVLKEIALSRGVATIGRSPHCLVRIDNPAVSTRHARVYWKDGRYFIEDTDSSNGTYVNDRPITQAALKDGDVVRIGKHTLEFSGQEPADQPGTPQAVMDRTPHWQQELDRAGPPKLDPTVPMDAEKARQLIAAKAAGAAPKGAPAAQKTGVLSVIKGDAAESQHILSRRMSVIGASETATVKLKGWLAPEFAAVIDKRGDKYFISPSRKTVIVKVNGVEISPQRELRDGDQIEVAGVKMAFACRPISP